MLVRRALGSLARPILRQTHVLTSSALAAVEAVPDKTQVWVATGCQPCFTLESRSKRLPYGWVRVRIPLVVPPEAATPGWLRAGSEDAGDGATSIGLPLPRRDAIDHFIRLPRLVTALQYEPVKGRCQFTLGPIHMQELG